MLLSFLLFYISDLSAPENFIYFTKIFQMSFKKVKRGLSKIFRNSSSNLREIPEEANENGNHPHNPTHHQGFVEKLSRTNTINIKYGHIKFCP